MSQPPEKTRKSVPAVSRAIGILRFLGKSAEPVGVNQLARALGLVPSTCLHILRVLLEEGLIAFDPQTKRYSIGVGILAIARGAMAQNSFARIIEPKLTELSRRFGGTAVATHLVGADQMIVVALSRAEQPFRLQVDLGSRFPALISATGRCHAAFNLGKVGSARLKQRFEALKWDDPPRFQTWKREVDAVRRDGFAIDRGAYISGITIIAVPFLDRQGAMTHSIVTIDITERIEAVGIGSVVERMVQIRDEVGELLIRPTG